MVKEGLISTHEYKAVSDVTKSPYMEMDCQFIPIYGKFVTSLSANYSCEDTTIRQHFVCFHLPKHAKAGSLTN